MAKKLIITETELREIIKEEIHKTFLKEGIDIDTIGGKRQISVNNSHQDYVDTNNFRSPYLFADNQRGFRTLSIFQRKSTEDKVTDSNPLLNALKRRKNWEFGDAKNDLMKLLKNFVAASKLLPKYDAIIMTPSHNELNKIVFNYLIRIIPHDISYTNFFDKLSANDVYENMIDDKYIQENFKDPNKVYNEIDDAISLMNKTNDGIFSYKCLLKSKYREAIIQSMKVNIGTHNDLNYADSINGKDVLVFDDTITTGKTISDSGSAITKMFSPKSITFVTLFSALSDENSSQEKVTTIVKQ